MGIPYDLNKPIKKISLEDKLKEISGIEVIDESTLMCVEDEHLNIYTLDLDKVKIIRKYGRNKKGDAEEHLAVSWGYVEVTGNNVKVLAETAEKAIEIDLSRAQVAREAAEKILTAGQEDTEYDEAQVRLEKAIIRVQVAGKK